LVASSVFFYNPSARTTQKTASIVKETCLLVRCLAMDVLLGALAPAGMYLPSRSSQWVYTSQYCLFFCSPKNTIVFYFFMSASYRFSFRVSMFLRSVLSVPSKYF
jgi:hypothetical protein